MADRLEDVAVSPAVRDLRLVGMRMGVPVAVLGVVEPPWDGHRSAPGHRREEADLVGRGDRRVEPGQVADVLAVDVDVDEPVEVAVVGQQLGRQRRMLLDERADDVADRVAVELERS